jgi:hypothetical protein
MPHAGISGLERQASPVQPSALTVRGMRFKTPPVLPGPPRSPSPLSGALIETVAIQRARLFVEDKI